MVVAMLTAAPSTRRLIVGLLAGALLLHHSLSTEKAVLSSVTSTVQLPDGTAMPVIGVGSGGRTNKDRSHRYEAVSMALAAGVRYIDTAAFYGDEAEVGKAIKDSGVPRSAIYVTTKLNSWYLGLGDVYHLNFKAKGVPSGSRNETLTLLAESLERLGMGYVD